MRAELPEGFDARGATSQDADVVLALVEAAEEHYDGVVEVEASDVEADFARVGFDLANDCLLVFEGDDAVAWAGVYRDRAEADVLPSRHRRGLGTAILRWTEARAGELGTDSLGQVVTDNNEDARELFLANGYAPGRISWVLQIDFDAPPPEHPAPRGIAIRPYDPGSDGPATYRVIEDAFGEWEGRQGHSFEEWAGYIVGHRAFSPELSRLAFEGEQLVGAALAFEYVAEEEGWIQQVATKATHRHRGIARALLSETFRAFYERGRRRCGLSTDSRTGALTLYERVGMHVRRSYTWYEKTLA